MTKEEAIKDLEQAFSKAFKLFSENDTIQEIEATKSLDKTTIGAINYLISNNRIRKQEYLNPEKNTLTLLDYTL